MSLSTHFEIRKAEPDDALCLSALATQVFFDTYATAGINADLANEVKEHFSEEAFAMRLASLKVEISLAEIGGNLAGFIDLQKNSVCPVAIVHGPEVFRLYIQSPFQNQGLGKALLRYAERQQQACGAKSIWLTTWVGNTRALAFYPHAGYEKVGSMQYIIGDKNYENYVFAKQLCSSDA